MGGFSGCVPNFGVQIGEWVTTTHDDGVVQWRRVTPWPARLFVERRPMEPWFVVDRHPPEMWRNAMNPPVLSGPFGSLDAAKAAYLVILAARDA